MIAAYVMTLEAQDNSAKIVPATACLESPAPVRMNKSMRENRFQSSASQTTFIDRDIVAVLAGLHKSKQKSVDSPSCSGYVQVPDTSGSTFTPDVTDRTGTPEVRFL